MSKWHMTSDGQWYDPDGNPSEEGPASHHAESLGGSGDTCASAWPVLSDAAGCHPDQIPEMRKHLASKGVDAKYTPDGRVIMESASHRKQVLKAMHMHDRNSCNGY